ncbi:methyltransferase domain-containing protein [Puniceicoccaceae bacterium]|nr:methyltransferase domain-containing protein [Puniceicoccaceae bacterium]
MRSTKFSLSTKSYTGWLAAVRLTEAYFQGNQKADQLLDALPEDFTGDRRAACQSLFLGGLRNGHRIRAALKGLVKKKIKPTIEAIFLVTGFEIIDSENERHPKIVHHAVEQSKSLVNRFEQGFLNAVLRKLPEALTSIDAKQQTAAFYSHPEWLVRHWQKEFPEHYRELMEWNQRAPVTYLKRYDSDEDESESLAPTAWPQFYRITKSASWKDDLHPLLNKGNAYIKDPSTRIAPGLLAPKAGEAILDLCAAPGGKAFDLAHAMQLQGTIVAVDLPGSRIERLNQNLETLRSDSLSCEIVESDLLELDAQTFTERALPAKYDGVMLDAPCSNTGVIQRRTDVKWRLRPKDIEECAKLQLQLLHSASRFVKDGGRLVYSTCSIEAAENQDVVDAFLKSKSGSSFQLEKTMASLPWETGHDGAGAFLLRKV